MIDTEGYRPNVGIILTNQQGQLLWAKRVNQDAWQFPQGGIQRDETPIAAMYRELEEEVGLLPEHVTVVACTRGWLSYRLPKRMIRHNSLPICIGQKQKWFLFSNSFSHFSLENAINFPLYTSIWKKKSSIFWTLKE